MKTRILSVFLSILLLTSFFTPVVSAELPDGWEEPELGAGPAVFAIPTVSKLFFDGLTVAIGGALVMKIGEDLGTRWDDFVKKMGIVRETDKDTKEKTRITDAAGNTMAIVHVTVGEVEKNWEKFILDVTKGLNDLIHAKEWIDVTSNEGKALMTVVYECWNAGGSSGGKKDDKWYFEARKNHGKIEINPEWMNEEQAVKEMSRGKNIMTLNEGLARKLVGRYEGIDPLKVEFEIHQGGKEGYFDHATYKAHEMRLHCWIWRKA